MAVSAVGPACAKPANASGGSAARQIRRYEAGKSAPTLDVLRNLAIALSVSADTLVVDAERNSDE